MLANIGNYKIVYYYSIIYYYAVASRNKTTNQIRGYSEIGTNSI